VEEERLVAIGFGANKAISQTTCINGILDRLGMQDRNPAHTPGHAPELRTSFTS